jgi:hypothetical protein
MEVRHRHDVGVGEVVGVMLLLEPETGEERGGPVRETAMWAG